jgi:hypothetical protein
MSGQQGFVRDLNFVESDTGIRDEKILNNLGGPNIKADIMLFDGNFRVISKLDGTDYTVNATTKVVTVTVQGKTAFSDGTKVSVAGSPTVFDHTITESNGIDKFKVVNAQNAAIAPSGILRRNDGVTAENLSNLSKKRLETNPSASSGVSQDDGASDLFNEYNASEQVDYINSQLGLFYYKRSRIPLTFEDSTFDTVVKFKGGVVIADLDATSSTQPANNTPGLFIIDPSNPSAAAQRAFSDASNPWSDQTTANSISTTNANSQPNVLHLKPSNASLAPRLTTTSTNIVSQSNTTASYTHKLPITINGEQFFLLVKL